MTARKIGPTVVSVSSYAAVGDGVHDDTRAFQCAVDALPADGGTVLVPDGTYLIDPLVSVLLRSYTRLLMEPGAVLQAIPNDRPKSNILWVKDVTEVEIVGGVLIGERKTHVYAPTEDPSFASHQWGHGIRVGNSINVTIKGTRVEYCTGDGVSVSGTNIWLEDVHALFNRRQGLTIASGKNFDVKRSTFSNNGDLPDQPGTPPSAGIDIEPDAGVCEDVLIEDCVVNDNTGDGVLIVPGPESAAVIRKVILRRGTISRNVNGIEVIRSENVLIENVTFVDQRFKSVRYGPNSSGVIRWNTFDRRGDRARFSVKGLSPRTEPDIEVVPSSPVTVDWNTYI